MKKIEEITKLDENTFIIVGEKYVFIHFPKTGGTFTENLLLKYGGKIIHTLSDSERIKDLPKKYENKFMFGFVRNPWDFYFSLFYFFKNQNADYSYLRFCSNNYKDSFNISIKRLLNPHKFMTNDEYRNYIKYIIICDKKNYNGNDFKMPLEYFIFMQKNNIGFCTLLYYMVFYKNLTTKVNNINIYKYENLKGTFRDILSPLLGIEFKKIENEFSVFLNFNKGKPKLHYSHYYDKELVDIIKEKDHIIIDNYNYVFESKCYCNSCLHKVSVTINH